VNQHVNIPAAVAEMIARAEGQRRYFDNHPDPLIVEGVGAREPALVLSAEELLEECAALPETDIGNANRLLTRYGHKILYVARVGWHGYDGMRWKEDEDGSVVRPLAQKTAEFIDDEAIMLDAEQDERTAIEDGRLALAEIKEIGKPDKKWSAEDLERYEKLEERVAAMRDADKARAGRMSSRHSHAKSSAGTTKINNMLTEAAPHCAKLVNDLNLDLYAINTRSGTLRFVQAEKDGQIRWKVRLDPHDPRDFITKLAPVRFDPEAQAPEFDRFFKQIMPDVDLRRFLQRYFGYCLLGLTVEQCLLFFYGAGRNGKSTLVDLMVDVLGDYAVSLSIDSFAGDSRKGGGEATPDLARLPGARMVSASEPEMGVRLKDALIKTLTGGDKISVRRLHQDFFELIPQFKIVLQGNHKPIITDDSDGIWRRVMLIFFEIQVPKEQVDPELPKKLRREADGVFAWMVAGALDYLTMGLRPPEKVLAATEEYRQESDPLGAFIRGACMVTGREDDSETPENMHIGYSNFARLEGLPDFKASTFSRRLPDQTRKMWESPQKEMKQFWKSKSGTTLYRGIRVLDKFMGRKSDSTDDADRYPPPRDTHPEDEL
jgi:putative DNA primase/helicase